MPLKAATPSYLKTLDDDKLRRESFAFASAWQAFRGDGEELPESMGTEEFLRKWKNVSDEMDSRCIEGAHGPPKIDPDEIEESGGEPLEEEESFPPPKSVSSAAERGLELRREFGRGGTSVGIARARDLSGGKSIPLSTVRRMHRFFTRHQKNKDTPPKEGNGKIAWLLWGGDPGASWARGILKKKGILESREEISESLKPIKVADSQFFTIEEREASILKEVPPGSKEVPAVHREWAIIVSNQETGENRARVVTVKNRTELIRRTKQEARRLGNPAYQVTGGELRAVSPSGQKLFMVVTSWIWGGPTKREESLRESISLSPLEVGLIRDVQVHLAAGGQLPPAKLEAFLEIETDFRDGPEEDDEDSSCLSSAASVMESIARAYSKSDEEREASLMEAWSNMRLSYLAVDEVSLIEAVDAAEDRDGYLEELGIRVLQQWPGFLSFDRMLSEDRVLVEAEEALLVRVCSGATIDMRPSWEMLPR